MIGRPTSVINNGPVPGFACSNPVSWLPRPDKNWNWIGDGRNRDGHSVASGGRDDFSPTKSPKPLWSRGQIGKRRKISEKFNNYSRIGGGLYILCDSGHKPTSHRAYSPIIGILLVKARRTAWLMNLGRPAISSTNPRRTYPLRCTT